MASKREDIDHGRLATVLRMAALTGRSIRGDITGEEQAELEQWFKAENRNQMLFEAMKDGGYRERLLSMTEEGPGIEEALAMVKQRLHDGERQPKPKTRYRYMAAAATIAIMLGCLFYFLSIKSKPEPVSNLAKTTIHDVPPGGTKARLVLANGSNITLGDHTDSAFTQSTVSVRQQQGKLTYASAGTQAGIAPYNTLVTPKGGMYSLVLADGTKVWLNAASSLKYPVQFSGNQRTVILTGEAYFEVVHKASQPFVVKVNGAEIQDIGTAFNIMAYKDEAALVTTVVDGTVRMETGHDSRLVHKGSSATIHDDDKIALGAANTQQALAWKDNHFRFRNADIGAVMRQISRWYDVSITYQGEVKQHFSGVISRDVNVSIVFQALERTGGVHFTIEGRNITVRP